MLPSGREAPQFNGVAGDVDAVANAVPLVGGVTTFLLQEIRYVLQDAIFDAERDRFRFRI